MSGTLLFLNAALGQTVQKGQLIAQVSSTQAAGQIQQALATLAQDQVLVQQAQANALQQAAQTQSGISQARANVRAAQATLDGDESTLASDNAALINAQQSLTRQQSLASQGLVAQKDIEASQLALQTARSAVDVQKKLVEGQEQNIAALKDALNAAETGTLLDTVKKKDILVAQQQVKNAQAALDEARAQASLYAIHAPLTGNVSAVGAAPGESVDTTTKLVTIADLSILQLSVGIPNSQISAVHLGGKLSFTTSSLPGKEFTTSITNIGSQVDPSTGTVLVYGKIDNSQQNLRDNMTVAGTLVEAVHSNVLAVPQSALLNDSDSGAKQIAVVGQDAILHIVPITTGIAANSQVEVLAGVHAGDNVVISGQYGLTDGTKVDACNTGSGQSAGNGS